MATQTSEKRSSNRQLVDECIRACLDCIRLCHECAGECIGMASADMARCTRLCLDCAGGKR